MDASLAACPNKTLRALLLPPAGPRVAPAKGGLAAVLQVLCTADSTMLEGPVTGTEHPLQMSAALPSLEPSAALLSSGLPSKAHTLSGRSFDLAELMHCLR